VIVGAEVDGRQVPNLSVARGAGFLQPLIAGEVLGLKLRAGFPAAPPIRVSRPGNPWERWIRTRRRVSMPDEFLVKPRVVATPPDQFVVRAAFDNSTLVQHEDLMRVPHSG